MSSGRDHPPKKDDVPGGTDDQRTRRGREDGPLARLPRLSPPPQPRVDAAEARPALKRWKPMGSYGTIGLEIVLCMLAGLFAGQWLDGRFGTAPWLSGLGFFFGIAAAGKALFRGWKEMQAETAREEREEGNPAPLFDPDEREADDEDAEPDHEPLDAPPPRDHPGGSEKP